MNKKITAYTALSFALIIFGTCGLSAGTIVHPEIAVYQSITGDSGSNAIEESGYQQGATGAVEIPGVLDIAPTAPNWPNFITADQQSQPYTLQGVKLVKQTPAQNVCLPGRLPQNTIVQTDSNIRLHWPLMYDPPGTTFTLTLDYSTPLKLRLRGETAPPSKLHKEVWKWRVASSIQDMERTQNLFISMPFGRSGVPLISDEALNNTLIPDAKAAYLAGDFEQLSIILVTYQSVMWDAHIVIAPTSLAPRGPGMGIANTSENPAASILLLDAAYMEPVSADSTGPVAVDAPDTTAVVFQSPKIVTMIGDGWFYVQNPNGISGLRVIGTKAGLSAGKQVLLQGTMSTQGPERVLMMTYCEIVTPLPAGDPLIRPLGMSNGAVGGAGNGCLPGIAGMVGLWNGAMLVRTTGEVTDTGNGFFYIDDGGANPDGTQYKGLRVILPSGVNPPAKTTYVTVTGISSWFDSAGHGFPAVLLGNGDDVTVIRPAP